MRRHLMLVLTFAVSLLVGAGNAQAVVVDMAGTGTSVAYPTAHESYVGVALVPGTRNNLATAEIPTVESNGPCTDPALSPDLTLPEIGLCSHGGSVMHANETFALVWDPNPHTDYAAHYVEQFLRDVADGSGTLTSPYAVTTQYTASGIRAGNASLYGGGYDFTANYPGNGCAVSGIHHYHLAPNGEYGDVPNDICLTDDQIKSELRAMIAQEGLVIQPGYTPLLVLLTPPGVEICLRNGELCSANSDSTAVKAQFCSYHSQIVDSNGKTFDYAVQPWTVQTGCDEPDAPALPTGIINPQTLSTAMGSRLVSPLSQAQIAAIVNPDLNGWFALDGSEINDNLCGPLGQGLDGATVGSGTYLLQREFNNAGIIANDPFTLACTPNVVLEPIFVVPSAADQGDVVQFDGSKSPSSLLVPQSDYVWDFGDGTTAVGPSVEHSYAKGGTYTVTLTLTDRGGNVRSLAQTISVLGPAGQVVAQPPGVGSNGKHEGLSVKLQLLPQSLRALLRHGVSLKVTANEPADGIASISIARSTAKRAHIAAERGRSVVIGLGTVKSVGKGTVNLHLRLSRKVAEKIGRLRHLTLTIRLTLLDRSGDKQTVDVAGRY